MTKSAETFPDSSPNILKTIFHMTKSPQFIKKYI